jgi:hypothetical protein
MKAKQPISPKSNKAANKALLEDVALKLSKEHTLFPEKVASAKAYLKLVNFSSKKNFTLISFLSPTGILLG